MRAWLEDAVRRLVRIGFRPRRLVSIEPREIERFVLRTHDVDVDACVGARDRDDLERVVAEVESDRRALGKA